MIKKSVKYNGAFSTGALFINESISLINGIDNFEDFMNGSEKLNFDLIPVNSDSSKRKIGNEIQKRLLNLKNPAYLHFIYNSVNTTDKALILFYASCKTYKLITDFMLDVVLDKWQNMDYELDINDFKNFFVRLAAENEELLKIKPSTIHKLSQVTIRMITELGMLKNQKLVKPLYNHSILRQIALDGDSWFLEILLLNNIEKQELKAQ